MPRKTKYDDWSKEELIKELDRIKETHYGLVFHRDLPEEKIDILINPDARTPTEMFPNEMSGKPFPVLKEIKGRAIEGKDEIAPVNLLIEGDNYHALAVLNFTHRESIDVIYIDPPYNTGESDFIYNDKIVDREDPYRHSKWLSFMEKRLKLAKNLLKNNGVIFISIDDNEQAQLKLLCDEIFDEKNFYGNLTWVKRSKSTNSGKARYMIQQKTEYILVYGRKTKQEFSGFKLLYSEEKRKYPHVGKFGNCRFENLEATDFGRKKRDTMKFPILGVTPREGRRWQIGENEAKRLVAEGKIELVDGVPKRAIYPDDEEGSPFLPFWSHLEETGTAEDGKQELNSILGPGHNFDTVKPIGLLKQLLERFDNNILVLDFFAGSGTTADAVLQLNSQDDGSRKFIICTNDDGQICSNICYPRVQRILKGFKNQKGDQVEPKKGALRYFKTDFVEAEPNDKNRRKLVTECTEMLCIREDAFEVVSDKQGDDFKIFRNRDKYMGIVFHEDAIAEFKNAISNLDKHVNAYIFSLGDDPHSGEFEDMKGKISLCAIPEVILKVYREIFK